MKLPKEDITLFLRVNLNVSLRIMREKNLDDIHEKDRIYQEGVYNYCTKLCKDMGWKEIKCSDDRNNKILTKDEIFEKILNELEKEGLI